MKVTFIILTLFAIQAFSSPKMQHGFILSFDNTFASHLVANGHHSWQASISGRLEISNPEELQSYQTRRAQTKGESYYLLQAQHLNLSDLKEGGILYGHIIESQNGDYNPENVVVSEAVFRIQKVFINIPNPFFLN